LHEWRATNAARAPRAHGSRASVHACGSITRTCTHARTRAVAPHILAHAHANTHTHSHARTCPQPYARALTPTTMRTHAHAHMPTRTRTHAHKHAHASARTHTTDWRHSMRDRLVELRERPARISEVLQATTAEVNRARAAASGDSSTQQRRPLPPVASGKRRARGLGPEHEHAAPLPRCLACFSAEVCRCSPPFVSRSPKCTRTAPVSSNDLRSASNIHCQQATPLLEPRRAAGRGLMGDPQPPCPGAHAAGASRVPAQTRQIRTSSSSWLGLAPLIRTTSLPTFTPARSARPPAATCEWPHPTGNGQLAGGGWALRHRACVMT
jgi:hypothetical protein